MSFRAVAPNLHLVERGDQKAKIWLRKPMSGGADRLSQPSRDRSGVDVSAEQFRTCRSVCLTTARRSQPRGRRRSRAYLRRRPEATAGALQNNVEGERPNGNIRGGKHDDCGHGRYQCHASAGQSNDG